jgi:F-type H+-transporting ATPase subunit gamma
MTSVERLCAMANTITLKRRISSVKNTRQITKAMQLVSASKMRRAQDQARLSRAYRDAANNLLAKLGGMQEVKREPLFQKREVKTRLYIVITSNSGLTGAYNSNVTKLLLQGVLADQKNGVKSQVITIGSKGAIFARKLREIELLAAYDSFGDQPTSSDVRPILNTILEKYREETIDEARVLYTKFISQLSQSAESQPIVPAQADPSEATDTSQPLISTFEPDVATVLDYAAIRLIEAQLTQSLLESLASEHSMRMMAMKNATDNATELIDDYTLAYNTARQAAITQELAEITGGAEALAS